MKLSPREKRALTALLDSASGIKREQLDRVAGVSNGPGIVQSLRRKVTGYDGLVTLRLEALDRDGLPCRPGLYRLTDRGREQALGALHGTV
jgi:hypothetical protein